MDWSDFSQGLLHYAFYQFNWLLAISVSMFMENSFISQWPVWLKRFTTIFSHVAFLLVWYPGNHYSPKFQLNISIDSSQFWEKTISTVNKRYVISLLDWNFQGTDFFQIVNSILGFASTETKFGVNNRPGTNAESLESSEPETTIRLRTVISPQKSSNESMDEPQTLIKSTVKVSPIKRPLQTQNDTGSANESLNSSRSSSDAKMMLKHFEFLRIVMCVMVAYLCRRVLSSGYGVFYFEVSLRIAFITFFNYSDQSVHTGGHTWGLLTL